MHSLVVFLALAGSLWTAGEPLTYTRFLIPIRPGVTPGAYGSSWKSEMWLYYAGAEEATFVPTPACCCSVCPRGILVPPGLPPIEMSASFEPSTPMLMHVDSRYAADATFASRIRDASRDDEFAGTEIPVIREERIVSRPLRILNVPMRASFRQMLRIYALPETVDPVVDVRYYRMPESGAPSVTPSALLRTDRISLRRFPPDEQDLLSGTSGLIPSFAIIGNVQDLAELAGEKSIWIEVRPVSPGVRIWAFVSVTNNNTQQVTIISP